MKVRLMGVVNVTPDSFSDGGLYLDAEAAVARGRELAKQGAEILDVGGESTRPGAAEVDEATERSRTEPVVAALAAAGHEVSIDTSKLPVAAAALEAGATIVNDITALGAAPEIATLCADRGAGLILMHMQGTPRTMQENPTYEDVVDDVKAFLAERFELALSMGMAEERIWLDPGIGFGKTLEHNLELLRRLGELRELGRPLVVGTSRKSFIGKIDGSEVDDRIGGTIASSILAVAAGADILRVHDVEEIGQALSVAAAIADPTAGASETVEDAKRLKARND
jgi:dihydropteroate synthase